MRRSAALAAGLLLASCTGKASIVERVEPEAPRLVVPSVEDHSPFGGEQLQVGERATYREKDRTLTVQVVGREGKGLWIEVIEEGDPRLVSARLVAPDGGVEKAFYAEIGKDGTRSATVPQPVVQAPDRPNGSLKQVSREEREERVAVAGVCKAVTTRFEDLEGRRIAVEELWHPDVPKVYSGSAAGGLVRRRAPSGAAELTSFGRDAKPSIEIPK